MMNLGHLFPAALLALATACSPIADHQPDETGPAASEPATPAAEAASEDCILTPMEGDVACTMQYDPVCGCDGVSYSNACMARVAGVPEWTPGSCEGDDPR